MKSAHKSNDSNTIKTVKTITFIAILVALSVILTLIFRYHTTTTTVTRETAEINYLVCRASSPEGAFFKSTAAESTSHELKVIFSNNHPSKFSYTFRGTYNSNANADHDIAVLHADYNNYMADHGKLDPEGLSPHFAAIDTTSEISLFSEVNKLVTATAQLFFIDSDQYQHLNDYSTDDLQNLYKSKGFICEIGK